jgi:hypothetical protein
LVGAVASGGTTGPFDTKSSNTLTVAVFGDSPYGTSPTDTAEFQASPAFIRSINADSAVDLVLHVGDIHSGKQYCTAGYDLSIFDLWTAFKSPLVYTPGDNEWTDCNKAGEGGGAYNKTTGQIDYVLDPSGNPVDYAKGDPIANLELIRSICFSNPGYALGQKTKLVLSQAKAFDAAHPRREVRRERDVGAVEVLFVTINLPGGSNSDRRRLVRRAHSERRAGQEVVERTERTCAGSTLPFREPRRTASRA